MKPGDILRKAAIGILSAGSTILIAACYGVYDYRQVAEGNIVNSDGEPVSGLKVCVENDGAPVACTYTDDYSKEAYYIEDTDSSADYCSENGFSVCVRDVDGAENGLYQDECQEFPPGTELPVTADFTIYPVEE
ncbi:MAG: hypothetical protein JXR95_02760 [Deltaproteobacteria bacterium]|nr:hypothetical protein [Deltaproteobacteria bacterium]